MTHILINGACGHMGRVIADVIANREDCTVLAGVDPVGAAYGEFPVYPSFDQVEEKADVIIDFSHPSALEGMLDYAKSHFTRWSSAPPATPRSRSSRFRTPLRKSRCSSPLICPWV